MSLHCTCVTLMRWSAIASEFNEYRAVTAVFMSALGKRASSGVLRYVSVCVTWVEFVIQFNDNFTCYSVHMFREWEYRNLAISPALTHEPVGCKPRWDYCSLRSQGKTDWCNEIKNKNRYMNSSCWSGQWRRLVTMFSSLYECYARVLMYIRCGRVMRISVYFSSAGRKCLVVPLPPSMPHIRNNRPRLGTNARIKSSCSLIRSGNETRRLGERHIVHTFFSLLFAKWKLMSTVNILTINWQ
jgi:hypothetical protein